MAVFKIVLNATFLIRLIGLKSVLAGYAAYIIFIPVRKNLGKKYSSLQLGISRCRDEKTNVLVEALHGIRQIRFLSLEHAWEDKVLRLRLEELGQLWKSGTALSFLVLFLDLGTILLASISLSMYALQTGLLSPSVAFTSLGLFEELHSSLGALPLMWTYLGDSWISCNRLERYLNEPEKDAAFVPSDSISFENATVTWPRGERLEEDSDQSELRNITLTFPNSELSVITGKIGSGKSLLLAAILGEADLKAGRIKVPERPSIANHVDLKDTKDWVIPSLTALVSQPPWIENCSIRDNILFGLPLDPSRYQKVLWACAIEKDLELLVDGDKTEVGPRGVSLSGGQKWRIAFARALYSRAGILLLDDILSAVDTHVARWLFQNALTGELAHSRTRILVTHHVDICQPRTKYLVQLSDGTVDRATLVEQSKNVRYNFPSAADAEYYAAPITANITTEGTGRNPKDQSQRFEENAVRPQASAGEEKRKVGRIDWHVYLAYFKASGGWKFWTIGTLVTIGYQLMIASRTWWLMHWTESYSSHSTVPNLVTTDKEHTGAQISAAGSGSDETRHQISYYIGVYMVICISTGIVTTMQNLFFFLIGINASKTLYQQMTHAILRAPLRWIDTVPSGQILNRFTSDMGVIDLRLSHEIRAFLEDLIHLMIIVITRYGVSPNLKPTESLYRKQKPFLLAVSPAF
jgi:ABC-type multidrug transport system fused ATPase/permease subunit